MIFKKENMKNYEQLRIRKLDKGDGEGTPLFNAITGDQLGTHHQKD